MKRVSPIITMIIIMLLLTSCMSASFSGNYVLQAGQTLRGNLFVTSGSVTLEENSRVTGTILLTSGSLNIGQNAQVGGDVAMTSGDINMAQGSVIHGDLILSSSDIVVHQAPGSVIEGRTTANIAPFIGSILTKLLLLYCVLPIVVLIAIILALGTWLGRQSKKRTQVAPAPASLASDDTQTKLQNLKKMLDDGLITETDYETKKTDLLARL